MPAKKKYVTEADCAQFRNQFYSEISVIKKALIGSDMRSGLVRDISDINKRIAKIEVALQNVQSSVNNPCDSGLSAKEKAAIISSFVMALGSVITALISIIR
jgi:hypothetical protein